jgi:hypothetical protein
LKLPVVRLLALATAACLTASAAPAINVVVSNETALLTFAEYQGLPLDLKPFSAAAVINNAEILSARMDGRIWYVVVSVTGPTLRNGGMRHCGAGEESNLVWLKLSGPHILDVRSVLYHSCAFSIESYDRPQPAKERWRVEYDSFSEMRKFVWTYDAGTPERGFSIASTPIVP